MTLEVFLAGIKTLDLVDGDVLLVTNRDILDLITRFDTVVPLPRVAIVYAESFDDLQRVSPETMNRAGWYRRADLS